MNNYTTVDPLKVLQKFEKRLDETTVAFKDFAYGAARYVCTVYFAGAEVTTAVAYFATRSVGWAIACRLIWLVTVAAMEYARDRKS